EPPGREQPAPSLLELLQQRDAVLSWGQLEVFDDGDLVLQEQPSESPDEPHQDLPLVVLAGLQSKTRTRTELAPCLRKTAVVRVDAELLVCDRHVVGPWQQLGMRALDVIRLVERIDDDLPVGRENGRLVPAEPEPVEVVGGQQFRERMQEVEQRLCIEI